MTGSKVCKWGDLSLGQALSSERPLEISSFHPPLQLPLSWKETLKIPIKFLEFSLGTLDNLCHVPNYEAITTSREMEGSDGSSDDHRLCRVSWSADIKSTWVSPKERVSIMQRRDWVRKSNRCPPQPTLPEFPTVPRIHAANFHFLPLYMMFSLCLSHTSTYQKFKVSFKLYFLYAACSLTIIIYYLSYTSYYHPTCII